VGSVEEASFATVVATGASFCQTSVVSTLASTWYHTVPYRNE
jgi:hypothetical protein